MGALTFLFLTFVSYLALKGRLGTYIALATTSDATPTVADATPSAGAMSPAGAIPKVPQFRDFTGNLASGLPIGSLLPSLPSLKDFGFISGMLGIGAGGQPGGSVFTYNPGKAIMGLPNKPSSSGSVIPGYDKMIAHPPKGQAK